VTYNIPLTSLAQSPQPTYSTNLYRRNRDNYNRLHLSRKTSGIPNKRTQKEASQFFSLLFFSFFLKFAYFLFMAFLNYSFYCILLKPFYISTSCSSLYIYLILFACFFLYVVASFFFFYI
jgi:hypothetical protein